MREGDKRRKEVQNWRERGGKVGEDVAKVLAHRITETYVSQHVQGEFAGCRLDKSGSLKI